VRRRRLPIAAWARGLYRLAMTPRQRHLRAPLLGAVVLVLVSGAVAALVPQPATHSERTYTLAELFAIISRQPPSPLFRRGWTIQVQGVLGVEPAAPPNAYTLRDRTYRVPMAHPGLMIAGGSSDPLVTAVRRVPVLAALIPPTADRPLLGRMATYRIEYIGPPPCLPSCEPVAPWRFLNGGS